MTECSRSNRSAQGAAMSAADVEGAPAPDPGVDAAVVPDLATLTGKSIGSRLATSGRPSAHRELFSLVRFTPKMKNATSSNSSARQVA